MAKYLYYAFFDPEDGGYNVTFLDLPGCITCGDNMSEALYMAKDALEGWMINIEDDGESIPTPSEPNQIMIPAYNLLIPIEADTRLARIKFGNKSIKKTLTLPFWLNEVAEKHHVNFSKILQEALIQYLDLNDRPHL